METLGDVKKAVAYALIRAGAKLIAVSRESFIVEIDADGPPETTEGFAAARKACESVLGIDAETWGDFIETETGEAWPNAVPA